MSATHLVAEQIAQHISEWLAAGRIVARTGNPMNAGDIIILVQRRGDLVEALLQACASRGIPTTGLDRLRLREHLAVWDVIALCDFLCDPQDDMALACLLLSPFVGLEYDALTALCNARAPKQSLWHYLQHTPDFQHITIILMRWRALADRILLLSPILSEILFKEGVMQHFIARCGEGVRDIIMVLLAQCTTYETSMIAPTLQAITQWLREAQVDIKRDLEAATDKVRIMTVHGAKGLEAPLIILADANDVPRDKTMLYPTLDIPTVLAIQHGAEKYSPLYAHAKAKKAEEAEAEYWRLLYVALTRACDELHIFGRKTRKGAHPTWYEMVQEMLQHSDNIVLHENRIMECGEACAEDNSSVAPHTDSALPPLPIFLSEALPALHPIPSVTAVTRLAHKAGEEYTSLEGAIQHTNLTAREMGIFIHCLLEKQAGMPFSAFLQSLPHYMVWVAVHRSLIINDADREYVLAIMAHLANSSAITEVLNASGLAEASLTGMVHSSPVIAQCDRIVITEDAVHVVDFKVAPAPAHEADIPASYRAQLHHYGALLAARYPQKKIRGLLLYINEHPCLLEVAI